MCFFLYLYLFVKSNFTQTFSKMQSKLECAFDFLYKKCNEETARELYVKRRPINA